MGEATSTSEARMRAAVKAVVTALGQHGVGLTRAEAISVLGVCVGTYAMTYGDTDEVIGKIGATARPLVQRNPDKISNSETPFS